MRHLIVVALLVATCALLSVSSVSALEKHRQINRTDADMDEDASITNNEKDVFSRNERGSIDLKRYTDKTTNKFKKVKQLLDSVCTVNSANGCQVYRRKIDKSLRELLKSLGKAIKYFDHHLLETRKHKKNRRPRHPTRKPHPHGHHTRKPHHRHFTFPPKPTTHRPNVDDEGEENV